ncbi:hypothetical protein [Bacillus halotolerans]|uniref:hypothetical protein n=1 Tax=Bacillus halotolerans TaxID=260554 RepID=UPI002930069F|nr:hypothetical protein [Bacillus halotolerans]
MILKMGNEKMKVASAFLSDDEQTVSAFDENGKRLVLLEGVNFENVWLEDDQGQRNEFPKKLDANQEIESLKKQLQTLTESLLELRKSTSLNSNEDISQQKVTNAKSEMNM